MHNFLDFFRFQCYNSSRYNCCLLYEKGASQYAKYSDDNEYLCR